jgi:hypothetical protein
MEKTLRYKGMKADALGTSLYAYWMYNFRKQRERERERERGEVSVAVNLRRLLKHGSILLS